MECSEWCEVECSEGVVRWSAVSGVRWSAVNVASGDRWSQSEGPTKLLASRMSVLLTLTTHDTQLPPRGGRTLVSQGVVRWSAVSGVRWSAVRVL